MGMYGADVDFYTIKGVCEEIFGVLGMENKVEWSPSSELAYMHPGRLAVVTVNGEQLGYVGEVHPTVADNYGIGTKAYVAVLNIDMMVELASFDKTFKQLPKFPAVQRDIAMLVSDEVIVKDIESVIKEKGGKPLESIQLFDVYKGKQIAEGFKSVAYNISFRAADRTLTDDDVSAPMKKIVAELETKLGAQLRDK
jgi:phenylalanyl-tRNA synthetase beta chain